MIALPWGFFYAGAPTVIASLWQVDDTATGLLMTRLYENLLGRYEEPRDVAGRRYNAGSRIPKADALREAKLWLRSLPPREAEHLARGFGTKPVAVGKTVSEFDFSHPYYWSAFILIGSPE